MATPSCVVCGGLNLLAQMGRVTAEGVAGAWRVVLQQAGKRDVVGNGATVEEAIDLVYSQLRRAR